MVEAGWHCLIDLAGTAYWTGKSFAPDPASERIVRFRSKRAAQKEVRRLARRGICVRHWEPIGQVDVAEAMDAVLQVLDEMYGSRRPKYEKDAQKRGIDLHTLVAAAVVGRIAGEIC